VTAVLRLEGLAKAYRGVVALDGVSLSVRRGSITGLIGPNGSGKSTLFDCVSGFQRQDAGRVWLSSGGSERDISGLPPVKVVQAGVRRTFQQLRVFRDVTVVDNLLTAGQAGGEFSTLAEVMRSPAVREHENHLRQRAQAILRDIHLGPQMHARAGTLSYGQQKMLELGMALITEPALLLLDEPVAGVNPALVEELKTVLLGLRERGITLFIVEHNLKLIFEICDAVFVLDRGEIISSGDAAAVSRDERVLKAYLG